MSGYVIQLQRLPGGSVQIDRKAERSGKYETAGWTIDDVVRERLAAKGWDQQKIDGLLKSLSEGEPHEVDFSARPFESYQAFRGFWSAGVPQKDHPKLFVCYASEDKEVAGAVSTALRTGKGIDVWYAPWEILAGGSVVGGIEKGLTGAQHIVVFLSAHSIKKAWPTAEREAATVRMIEDGTNLIPVNLGLGTKDMPALLRPRKWVTMSGTTSSAVEAAVSEISASIFGQTERPPLGPMPRFTETPAPTLPGHDLSQADRVVLGILFELGKEQPAFQVGPEAAEVESREKGIDRNSFEDSSKLLKEKWFIHFEQYGRHSFGLIEVRTQAVEACCRELVPDYSMRKRAILAAVINGPDPESTSNEEVIERTNEEPWLVGHVLRDAEERGLLSLSPVYVGHPYQLYQVHSVSARLKRELQNPQSNS